MSVQNQPLDPQWYEASARDRLQGLLDPHSFVEWLGPEQRLMSPHLSLFDLTGAFDDGIIIGEGRLEGARVFAAAQEGRFMGGAFGEVHGAKLVGLLRAAVQSSAERPRAVLLALDTGGVRLQEANAGELAISEIIFAIAEARRAGVPVIALVGGRAGAFGGGGIIAASCSTIVIARHGRISVSGPEVIETNQGVEEFDAKDKALVWRITGGRTRYLEGGADLYVKGGIRDFRAAAQAAIPLAADFSLDVLAAEQQRLEQRLAASGQARDAIELWQQAGIDRPEAVADIDEDEFMALARLKEARHGSR